MSPTEEWTDEECSLEMPALRHKGEGQELEFKERLPEQTRDLGKEIAAFASSNSGKILLAVDDTGELVGMPELKEQEGRDKLIKRIQGICRGTVKPAITPKIKFAKEDNHIVAIIIVPKGSQPIYYCNSIPYIRHISESRPGEPHEIIDLIRNWMSQGNDALNDHEFCINLANILIDIIIFANEVDKRDINPGLDILKRNFKNSADNLRKLGSTDIANDFGINSELEKLAEQVDEAANYYLLMGPDSYDKFKDIVNKILDRAKETKSRWIDEHMLDSMSIETYKRKVRECSRSLEGLSNRVEKMTEDDRINEIISHASKIGFNLLKLSYFGLNSERSESIDKLREIGLKLHLLDADDMNSKIFIDQTLETISLANQELKTIFQIKCPADCDGA
jgi:ATP-dependent DNA helicase RecG